MSECDPRYIRIYARKSVGDNGEWFDPEHFTHQPDDTLYVKETEIIEHLISKGWTITLSKDKADINDH